MASTKEYLDFVLEQLSGVDDRKFLRELVESMWEGLPEKKSRSGWRK